VKYWTLAALAMVACAAESAYCWPAVFPTGTTLYEPQKAYNGYTLFTPMGHSLAVHLINMNGQVVHEWTTPFLVMAARLLPNGNLVVVGFDPQKKPGRPGLAPFWMGGTAGFLVEMTWEGKEAFRHNDRNMHHDALRLPNGNYLYLAWEKVPPALREKVRGGIKDSEHRDVPEGEHPKTVAAFQRFEKAMFNDVLVEITPQHKVVWVWQANHHLDPDIDIIGLTHAREEWCHTNTINVLSNGDVLLTSRALDCMLVVSRKTGDVIFRWGGMTHLDKETGQLELTTTVDTLSGPHGAQEIPRGVPGAGHITCYDNGLVSRGPLLSSRGVEVDPETGTLVWQSGALVENRIPVPFGRKHFSDFLGSAQKLPNGNMLLCEGVNGRFFQITEDHEEVWEYVNPFIPDERFNGSVFKIQCYAPDYCPQFNDIPPAKGPAVVPVANASVGDDGGPPAFWPRSEWLLTLAAGMALAAGVAFALGWALRGRRAAGNWQAADVGGDAPAERERSSSVTASARTPRSAT
jgi:hypothetical protein